MAEPLAVTRDGAAAWMSFTRPSSANSIDLEFARAFREQAEQLEADESCSVLVLSGDARFFSAGGDVRAMNTDDDPAAYLAELVDTLHTAIARLAASRLVVVSVVEGTAAGAGFALVLNSDLVVSGDRARYLAAYGSVGLTPDTGLSYLLPRVVGERRAAELTLLGRVLDAETALSWGLVNEVVPSKRLHERAAEIVRTLARAAQPALAETKRLLTAGRTSTFAEHLQDERDTIVGAIATPAAKTRIDEFLGRSSEVRHP
ncbi:MAG: enoyl-CoA hydratase/isomerase family protein [Actinomycetota bacterium]